MPPKNMTPKTHGDPLTIWTIYREPSDHPGCWVLRAHDVFPGKRTHSHDFFFVAATLNEIRAKVPPGTWCIGRTPIDHPVIYESRVVEVAGAERH
jgi:hypothetical protein